MSSQTSGVVRFAQVYNHARNLCGCWEKRGTTAFCEKGMGRGGVQKRYLRHESDMHPEVSEKPHHNFHSPDGLSLPLQQTSFTDSERWRIFVGCKFCACVCIPEPTPYVHLPLQLSPGLVWHASSVKNHYTEVSSSPIKKLARTRTMDSANDCSSCRWISGGSNFDMLELRALIRHSPVIAPDTTSGTLCISV